MATATTTTEPGVGSEMLLAHLPVPALAVDAQGLVVAWTEALAEMLDCPTERAMGQAVDDVLPEEARSLHRSETPIVDEFGGPVGSWFIFSEMASPPEQEIDEGVQHCAQSTVKLLAEIPQFLKDLEKTSEEIGDQSEKLGENAGSQVGLLGASPAKLQRIAREARDNVKSIERATEIASDAQQSASDGRAATDDLIRMIGKLRKSDEANVAIVQTISEFAKTASDLASAAAKEAEKVNSSGRGVAVVADHVRTLAQRTKESAARLTTVLSERRTRRGSAGVDDADDQRTSITIIREIEQVAFETNLLAINVAIEAAHFGAAGMGFAEITDEVRELAETASQSAREGEELIMGSVELALKTEKKSELVGKLVVTVADSANEISSLVSSVTEACSTQAAEIEHFQDAVGQVNALTTETVEAAEEMFLNADNLQEMSEALAKLLADVDVDRLTAIAEGNQPTPEPEGQDEAANRKDEPDAS